jgi:hypothetical protein
MNTAQKNPDPRALRYLQFVTYHHRTELSDEEIARQLGFGSPKALYQRLISDGYPVCAECGATPVKGEHCPQPRKRAAAKGEGGTVELPHASGAVELLERALERFRADITHLPRRREYLQDERFAVREEWTTGFEVPRGKTPVMRRYTKEGTDPESWRRFCEERGEDPEQDFFYEPLEAMIGPAGASPVLPQPLTRLIGTYALSGEPIEPLLEALHPAPEEIDVGRLGQAIEELTEKAGQVATLVRGGKIRRGPRTEELDPLRHAMAAYIHRRNREGASYDRIAQELREGALSPRPEKITSSEVERLAGMRLE